jgi:hypothetical protein
MHNNHCHRATAHVQLNILLSLLSLTHTEFITFHTLKLVRVTCLLVSVNKLQPVTAVTVNLLSVRRPTLTKVNNLVQKGVEFNEMATLVINCIEQKPS